MPIFCAGSTVAVDRIVYRPLRNAPKLAPLVSAIGVSFIFMNIGLFWAARPTGDFPDLVLASETCSATTAAMQLHGQGPDGRASRCRSWSR